MNQRPDPLEPDLALPDEAPADPSGRWYQRACTLGYANVAPLVADLRVAYDDGRIARASGRPCRQVVFRGEHAKVWMDGWYGLNKPKP